MQSVCENWSYPLLSSLVETVSLHTQSYCTNIAIFRYERQAFSSNLVIKRDAVAAKVRSGKRHHKQLECSSHNNSNGNCNRRGVVGAILHKWTHNDNKETLNCTNTTMFHTVRTELTELSLRTSDSAAVVGMFNFNKSHKFTRLIKQSLSL